MTSFTFDQLDDKAKTRALDKARNWEVNDNDWADCVIEDAVRMGALLGIEIGSRDRRTMDNRTVSWPAVYWQLYTQGSGVWFDGEYHCKPDAIAAVKAECNDEVLLRIAEQLTAAQVVARMEGKLPLMAEMTAQRDTMHIAVDHGITTPFDDPDCASDDEDREIHDCIESFASWIHGNLESEYDYLTSEEHLTELLRGGDYKFDEDGGLI